MSFDYQFKGRKPSYKQIMKVINNAVDWGNEQIDIGWGENSITIQRNSTPFNRMGPWYGFGWIKDISGDNIAKELNTR